MKDKLRTLKEMARRDLTENLLPWWMQNAPDGENGGFYGACDPHGAPIADAERVLVLNARLVWTFSSAYRQMKNPQYRAMAERAYAYLTRYFYDPECGGFYYILHADGSVSDPRKHIYGNAFAIYGLSEYYRATGCEEALRLAGETVAHLEERVYDPLYGGYFESCRRDWSVDPWAKGMNARPTDIKTMNTHLHLLEAYTCALRARETPLLRNKVREHLYVMRNRIVNPDIHHLYYMQDREWRATSPIISYGHDIEASWLMYEAARVLNEPETTRLIADECVRMARACYETGRTDAGAMRSEYDPVARRFESERLSWWEQNETVVGMLNAWQLTGEEQFLDASLDCFRNIERTFVDRERGGWHAFTTLAGEPIAANKITGYICPYHNSRMSLEVLERLGGED